MSWGQDSKPGLLAPEFFLVPALELKEGNLGVKKLPRGGFLPMTPQGQPPALCPHHPCDVQNRKRKFNPGKSLIPKESI